MAMDRWDPFRDMTVLRDVMERAFQEGIMRPASALLPTGRGSIPVDVREENDTYILHASLPGVRPEDAQVTISGDVVTIQGHTTQENTTEEQHYLVHERRTGSFSRTLTLPTPVNPDAARATFEHGILTLRLPKSEHAQPRSIPISNGTSARKTAPGQGNAQNAQASMETPTGAGHAAANTGNGATNTTSQSTNAPQTHASNGRGTGTNLDAGGNTRETITEAAKESFPASDAPGWTPEEL